MRTIDPFGLSIGKMIPRHTKQNVGDLHDKFDALLSMVETTIMAKMTEHQFRDAHADPACGRLYDERRLPHHSRIPERVTR